MKSTLYRLYEDRLWNEAHAWRMPEHIGIVLDGNRRFAREQGTAVHDGHARGADKLDDVLTWCERLKIRIVTVWAFSVDNFTRSAAEVSGLMTLFEERLRALATNPRIHDTETRVRAIGRTELLPDSVRAALNEVESATRQYTWRTLNIGIAYGGREEIVDAFRRCFVAALARGDRPEQIAAALTPESIEPYLYTAHVPHPDLIIRTSGEVRLSGFMLWQSAHSEYYFCDTYWPAFRAIDFLRALRSYHQRQRRYGR
ncbi:MAG: di-trans,poly-cis-decaprenylcistransferase [Deltaproteobacteria bacterium]|nr:di-trans,poly-cis-decaprenylcistransferase [Deltaproteobacteria bacterium]